MKKLIMSMLLIGLSAKADVVLSNATVQTQVVVATNTMTVANAKVIWTGFAINYMPPAYTQAVYLVNYVVRDMTTGREIPGSRGTRRMTEAEVAAFAQSKGVDFSGIGQGIGYLLNEYLKTVFTK
ncbi:MAG: hypothetical protein WCO84_06120 [bacterium]